MTPKTRQEKAFYILEAQHIIKMAMTQEALAVSSKISQKDPFVDLPFGQLHAAITIFQIEPCSLSELSQALRVSGTSASLMVDRLVERGLVLRSSDPKDRRRIVIRLEPRIRKYVEEVSGVLCQWLQDITKPLGEDFLDEWYEIMKKIRQVLNDVVFKRC